jgi:hypothetical protein
VRFQDFMRTQSSFAWPILNSFSWKWPTLWFLCFSAWEIQLFIFLEYCALNRYIHLFLELFATNLLRRWESNSLLCSHQPLSFSLQPSAKDAAQELSKQSERTLESFVGAFNYWYLLLIQILSSSLFIWVAVGYLSSSTPSTNFNGNLFLRKNNPKRPMYM